MSNSTSVLISRIQDKSDTAKDIISKSNVSISVSPSAVNKMLEERRVFQCTKFRTNCSDCVPNL